MSCQEGVYQWAETVHQELPHLSRAQALVLALFSYGMVVARSCALTAVSIVLAASLGSSENTMRQRLRESCYAASDKRGSKRQELSVEQSFAPLLRWVLRRWTGTQLALAIDASSLGDRFVVLAVSVVYRGCAIPVAWRILPAGKKGAWRGEWLRLLHQLSRAVPRHYTVLVLADRGLYAGWLYRRIVRLGWHPFLRVNLGGSFRPACASSFHPFRELVPAPGSHWAGSGVAFKTKQAQLPCTLLARWDAPYKDPWLILTDLAPAHSDACWYGLRTWIEQGFKVTKRGGFQWQRTRMTDPQRAARLWLAIAVATLWLLSVGGEADAELAAVPQDPIELPATVTAPRRPRKATRLRLVSVFRRGWTLILVALLNQQPLPLGRFLPEPWPLLPPLARPARTAAAARQNTYP
jgi:Transposase DDE domain